VIKTKKSTQAVTPVPSQAEITPQPASTSISEIEAVEESLKALKSRMIQDAADRAKDKKKIESIEQALQEAKTGEKGKKNFTQLTDDGQGLRKENHELQKNNDELHKENHELKKHMSELRHRIATLMQGSIAPTSFKVMDGDVEREWKGIAFDIRNFVSQVLTKRPYRESAPRGANQNDVQALKKHLSKDANTAPYHFQRYIWLHLVEDVFQAGKATWGGPAGNAFHRYCLNISGMLTVYFLSAILY
jgi:myosin heavy subunit